MTDTTKVTPLVTAKDKLQQQGEELIDTENRFIIPVKLEIYTKNKTTLNIRNDFIIIFNAMKKVDATLAILTDDVMWKNSSEFPVDQAFLDTFDVQNRPQQRNPSISMFFTCASTMTVNAIKYHDLV